MTNSAQGASWTVDNFFFARCGATECLYELFITAPFYTSAAYTLGWLCKNWMIAKR